MLHYATVLISFIAARFAGVLIPLQSEFSIASLFSALCVAVAFILLNRRPEKRVVPYRLMFRALFPTWLYRNASFRADVRFLLLSVLAFGALFGWAIVSADVISAAVRGALTAVFGTSTGAVMSGFANKAVVAVCLFIAYELAYWFDHYLSHRIPTLWEFHKVHHTAEVLTPLTNFRVHPMDTVVFGNITAVFIGATHGVMSYLKFDVGDGTRGSIIVVACMWILGHLHHSHLWISFTGRLGHIVLSPAHHQIHHSDNPKHFNKNFGAFLSVWDWMFGTLHMPGQHREPISFGTGGHAPTEHTVIGGLVTPYLMAWRRINPRQHRPRSAMNTLDVPSQPAT